MIFNGFYLSRDTVYLKEPKSHILEAKTVVFVLCQLIIQMKTNIFTNYSNLNNVENLKNQKKITYFYQHVIARKFQLQVSQEDNP